MMSSPGVVARDRHQVLRTAASLALGATRRCDLVNSLDFTPFAQGHEERDHERRGARRPRATSGAA